MEEKKTMLLEGLLPADVWNAIIVLLILFGVAVALLKGIAFIRDEVQKNKDKKKLNKKDVTDEIADKVIDKLTPQIDEKFKEFNTSFDEKFKEIDKKLASDKEDIALHTTQLNDHETRVGRLEGANGSLCQGMLALLKRDPALSKAEHAMENYLITGKYNPNDWV